MHMGSNYLYINEVMLNVGHKINQTVYTFISIDKMQEAPYRVRLINITDLLSNYTAFYLNVRFFCFMVLLANEWCFIPFQEYKCQSFRDNEKIKNDLCVVRHLKSEGGLNIEHPHL